MKKILKRRSGEGYIDVCVLVVCAMLVLALVVRVLPVYITKQQLDTYAVELVREAEIAGRVGTETTRRAAALTDSTGLDPDIRWSTTGRIQLNDEVTVTLTLETDIGLFGVGVDLGDDLLDLFQFQVDDVVHHAHGLAHVVAEF